jgi:hypothetical protein
MVGVLWFLHCKSDQIITGNIDIGGCCRVQLAGQIAREDRPVHRLIAQFDTNFGTVAVDEFRRVFRQTRVTL